MRKTLLVLSILVILPGFAQSGQAGSPSQKQEQIQSPQQGLERDVPFQTAEGQLTKVDSQKQLIWLKTLDGKEIQFSYTKDTMVEGSRETVEGLATMSGTKLKVQFRSENGVNTALSIEVQTVASR